MLKENRSADDFIEKYQRVANTHTKTKYVHLFISGLQASIYSGEVSLANPKIGSEIHLRCVQSILQMIDDKIFIF